MRSIDTHSVLKKPLRNLYIEFFSSYFQKLNILSWVLLYIYFLKILFEVCVICIMVMNDYDEYEFGGTQTCVQVSLGPLTV